MIVGACRPHNAFEQKARQQTRARLHQSPSSSNQTASQYVRQLAAGGIMPTGGVIPEHVMLQAIREMQEEVNDANQTMQQLLLNIHNKNFNIFAYNMKNCSLHQILSHIINVKNVAFC